MNCSSSNGPSGLNEAPINYSGDTGKWVSCTAPLSRALQWHSGGAVVAAKTILIVDSDPALHNLLRLILEEEGYKVVSARCPAEATTLLSDSHFDLVITEAFEQQHDFDFDPSFLARFISMDGKTPIILFSTYVPDSRVREGQFGLAAVLPKPFDIDDLLCKVDRVLKHHNGCSE